MRLWSVPVHSGAPSLQKGKALSEHIIHLFVYYGWFINTSKCLVRVNKKSLKLVFHQMLCPNFNQWLMNSKFRELILFSFIRDPKMTAYVFLIEFSLTIFCLNSFSTRFLNLKKRKCDLMDVADCLWGSGFPSYEPCWFTLHAAPSQQDASLMARRTLALQFGGGYKIIDPQTTSNLGKIGWIWKFKYPNICSGDKRTSQRWQWNDQKDEPSQRMYWFIMDFLISLCVNTASASARLFRNMESIS